MAAIYGGDTAQIDAIGTEFAELADRYLKDVKTLKEAVSRITTENIWLGGADSVSVKKAITDCYPDLNNMYRAIMSYSKALHNHAQNLRLDFGVEGTLKEDLEESVVDAEDYRYQEEQAMTTVVIDPDKAEEVAQELKRVGENVKQELDSDFQAIYNKIKDATHADLTSLDSNYSTLRSKMDSHYTAIDAMSQKLIEKAGEKRTNKTTTSSILGDSVAK